MLILPVSCLADFRHRYRYSDTDVITPLSHGCPLPHTPTHPTHTPGLHRFPDLPYDVEADIPRYKEYAARLAPFVTDTIDYVNAAAESGKRVLVEGANATMLDLDYGTYPFVTSSNPSIGGIITGLGLAPRSFEAVVGVVSGGGWLWLGEEGCKGGGGEGRGL